MSNELWNVNGESGPLSSEIPPGWVVCALTIATLDDTVSFCTSFRRGSIKRETQGRWAMTRRGNNFANFRAVRRTEEPQRISRRVWKANSWLLAQLCSYTPSSNAKQCAHNRVRVTSFSLSPRITHATTCAPNAACTVQWKRVMNKTAHKKQNSFTYIYPANESYHYSIPKIRFARSCRRASERSSPRITWRSSTRADYANFIQRLLPIQDSFSHQFARIGKQPALVRALPSPANSRVYRWIPATFALAATRSRSNQISALHVHESSSTPRRHTRARCMQSRIKSRVSEHYPGRRLSQVAPWNPSTASRDERICATERRRRRRRVVSLGEIESNSKSLSLRRAWEEKSTIPATD